MLKINKPGNSRALSLRYRWVILGVLWAAYTGVVMQRLAIGPLAPFLKAEMALTSTQIGLLASASAFGYMIVVMPGGWLADRINLRWLLLIGDLIGGIFMLVIYVTPSYQAVLVVMAMAGLGSGFVTPSTTRGIMVWFPIRERATAMGFNQTSVNFGGIFAAAVLPGIALALGWRYGFLILGITAIAIGILSFILYKEPPALKLSPAKAVSSLTAPIKSSFGTLLKSKNIWLGGPIPSFTLALAQLALTTHLVLYLTEELSIPVLVAGGVMAVALVGGIAGKLGGGLISDRLFGGRRKQTLMVFGGLTLLTSLILASGGLTHSWVLYPVLFIMGIGVLGWGGLMLTLAAELGGKAMVGRASAISVLFVNAGSIVGPLLFGYFVDLSGSYRISWLISAVAAAIALTSVALVKETRE